MNIRERGITVKIEALRSTVPALGDIFVKKGEKTVVAAGNPRRRGINARMEAEQANAPQYLDVQQVAALLRQFQREERLLVAELSVSSSLSPEVIEKLLTGKTNRLMDSTQEGLQRLAQEYASHPVGQRLQEELAKPKKEDEKGQRTSAKREAARKERDRRRRLIQELKDIVDLEGISQRRLDLLLDVGQPNINRLLKGNIVPRKKLAERIEYAIATIKAEREARNSPQE